MLKMELRVPWMLTIVQTEHKISAVNHIFLRAFFAFLDLDLNTGSANNNAADPRHF
jgi:hypothetical protein